MVICLPQRPQCRGRPSSSLTVGIEPENVDGHGGGRDLTHNPVSRANGPASERLTSSLTVARDLGKRGSAQRWAATYSHGRGHRFKPYRAHHRCGWSGPCQGPADSTPHVPRPRCGRSLLPGEPGGSSGTDDTGPSPAQRPRSVVITFPVQPMVGHHAGNLPRTAPAGGTG
jgi:hypothetical protein